MKIGSARIEVTTDDIITLDSDAVVIPANTMLWTGGGVAARVRRSGGDVIEHQAMAHAPAAIGTAVATSGGDLRAATVVHAVIAGQDLVPLKEAFSRAVRSALETAGEGDARSVAVPLLNGETHPVEPHIAARMIVDEVIEYLLAGKTRIERIWLVEQDETDRDIFTQALKEKFTRHG